MMFGLSSEELDDMLSLIIKVKYPTFSHLNQKSGLSAELRLW